MEKCKINNKTYKVCNKKNKEHDKNEMKAIQNYMKNKLRVRKQKFTY